MRLIDADALKAWFFRPYSNEERYCNMDAAKAIDDAPTIDAVPVVHGKWYGRKNHKKCSVCDKQAIWDVALQHDMETPYCPNCGARMDRGKQE